ncbi:hypothetical protein [Halalkalibacter krulwichiae]|uniref:Pore-forming protein n=1 Tax=Halalkalibacter krulwichiae TaxID=199441 RepID=A0A1X9MHA6_9BACI|nr:hypothetical protein [Halalkalibacter krulwichiae]ARK31890.1 hypothetical protein BkAM31D_19735 [Halalkalibacter krulwichiae]
MNYKASEPKFLWILLFILTITYAYALESTALTNVAYALAFFFFAGMTLRYELEIREDELFRVVHVIGFTLKKQTIHADEIEKLEVIQVGERSIILLYLKKKMRIKLQRFSPEGLSEHLIEFSRRNNIRVERKG